MMPCDVKVAQGLLETDIGLSAKDAENIPWPQIKHFSGQ